jgi:rhodanese-related sulfurtransferase
MLLERLFEFRNRGDVEKPFLSHIEDLRFTIIKVASALVGAMVVCFAFRDKLAALIQHPLIAVDPQRAANIQSLGVADSFTISLELSFYGGLVLAFPFLVYFIAEFILPRILGEFKAHYPDVRTRMTVANSESIETRVADVAALVGGDKTKPVVVYCRSGARSSRARGILQGAGFTNVVDAGGYGGLANRFPGLATK